MKKGKGLSDAPTSDRPSGQGLHTTDAAHILPRFQAKVNDIGGKMSTVRYPGHTFLVPTVKKGEMVLMKERKPAFQVDLNYIATVLSEIFSRQTGNDVEVCFVPKSEPPQEVS